MLPDTLISGSGQLCQSGGLSPTSHSTTCTPRSSTCTTRNGTCSPTGRTCRQHSGSRRGLSSQSLRDVPTLPTTRCSCVLLSANSRCVPHYYCYYTCYKRILILQFYICNSNNIASLPLFFIPHLTQPFYFLRRSFASEYHTTWHQRGWICSTNKLLITLFC